MNKYKLNAYYKPFVLKDGSKVYPKISTLDEIKGVAALILTITVLTIVGINL